MNNYWGTPLRSAPTPAAPSPSSGPWDEPRIRALQQRILDEAPDVETGGATEEDRIRGWMPALQWVQRETGLPPETLAGIMHAESKVGDSDLTRDHRNFFSVEANDYDQFMQGRAGRWASYPTPKHSLARFVGMIAHPENTYNTKARTWDERQNPDVLIQNLLAAGYGVDEPGFPMSQWQVNVRAGRDLYNSVAPSVVVPPVRHPGPIPSAQRPYEQGGGDAEIPIGSPFEWGGNIAPDGRGDDDMPLGHDDCSSFIANLIAHLTGDKVRLPALTDAQVEETEPISPEEAGPGDLAFSRYPGQGEIDWGHVAMMLGNGKVLDQSTSDEGPLGRPGIDIRPLDHTMDQGGEMIFRRIPGLR
jgi:hypothetical protein